MLDTRAFETLAASPSLPATVVLLLFVLAIQWYFSLPPRPKFPRAELDEKDWHGSFEKAKSKVRHRAEPIQASTIGPFLGITLISS